jgi:hypothetical protein
MTTTVSTDRHRPNRFSSYTKIHETVIRQFIDTGFIGSENLAFSPQPNRKIRLKGEISCLGEIIISVDKMLDILDWVDDDAIVQSRWYAYNASVKNHGNILRYDNQDFGYLRPGHLDEHHRHSFDWHDGHEYPTSPTWIGRDQWPVLSDVIFEIQDWYWDNRILLPFPDSYSEIEIRKNPPSLEY